LDLINHQRGAMEKNIGLFFLQDFGFQRQEGTTCRVLNAHARSSSDNRAGSFACYIQGQYVIWFAGYCCLSFAVKNVATAVTQDEAMFTPSVIW
jgi:hypothetical protein